MAFDMEDRPRPKAGVEIRPQPPRFSLDRGPGTTHRLGPGGNRPLRDGHRPEKGQPQCGGCLFQELTIKISFVFTVTG